MESLHESGFYVTPDPAFLEALLIPETGARMATIARPTGILAKIIVAPGDGLIRRLRKGALMHEFVSVNFRADVYFGKPAPAYAEFDAETVKWACRHSSQIAIWTAPFPQYADEYSSWMRTAANAGAAFRTTIETTPSRAAEWGAAVERWKGPKAEVRFFGPAGVQ